MRNLDLLDNGQGGAQALQYVMVFSLLQFKRIAQIKLRL